MKRIGFLLLALLMLLGILPVGAQEEPEIGSVTLYYHDNAQVELISPEGVRVLIDVYNPALLSTPATEDDILLTTHSHSDHYLPGFVEEFPGQQLDRVAGEIESGDVHVWGIPSAHLPNDEMTDEGSSNYIFIVDIGGLRVAHFGDIGQEALTDEQLELLGEVDIAITQFVNPFSQMDVRHEKGFNLVAQFNPKLIIPTHYNLDALEVSVEKWEDFQTEEEPVVIDSTMLVEGETRILLLSIYAKASANLYQTPDWATAVAEE